MGDVVPPRYESGSQRNRFRYPPRLSTGKAALAAAARGRGVLRRNEFAFGPFKIFPPAAETLRGGERELNYADIRPIDVANGPGVRVSLFVSGCTHHCPGCFNEVAWDFGYGEPFTQQTIDLILDMLRPDYIRGLTLLGGEPFEPQNQGAIVELLRQIKREMPRKSIWAFSGYLFEKDILSGRLGDTREYLSYLDVLVDGPFVEAKKNLSLRFRGSENQRLIDVPASLAAGKTVLWEDWQGEKRGMKG